MSRSGPSIAPILAVNFVGALGFSIVLPFLVFLVTRLGGNAMVYGVMGATYSAFQLVGAPVLGRWSDRVGRRRILLLSQLGTLLSWGVFLVALSLPVREITSVDSSFLGAFTLTVPLVVLFLARALDGLTGGNVSVASAYLADITSEEERSANFGRLAVSSNLGFVLGPAIAGLLGATGAGEWLPVLAALAISAVAMGIILVALEDPEPCALESDPEPVNVGDVLAGDHRECVQRSGGTELSTRAVLALPNVARLLLLQFLVFLAFNFFYVAFPVHAATGLAWTLTEVGTFFTVMAILMAGIQGPVLGYLSKRVQDRPLVLAGSVLLAASFGFYVSERTWLIYLGTALLAVGNGLMWPSLLSILSKATDARTQGAVQGLAGSVNATASILGLLAGGLLYGWVGSDVFAISAVITAFVFVNAFWIREKAGPVAA